MTTAIPRPTHRQSHSSRPRPDGRGLRSSSDGNQHPVHPDAARLTPVMGPANRASWIPIMGRPDSADGDGVMGGPDAGQRTDVMGGPDDGVRQDMMGQSDPKYVDSLFTGDATR